MANVSKAKKKTSPLQYSTTSEGPDDIGTGHANIVVKKNGECLFDVHVNDYYDNGEPMIHLTDADGTYVLLDYQAIKDIFAKERARYIRACRKSGINP